MRPHRTCGSLASRRGGTRSAGKGAWDQTQYRRESRSQNGAPTRFRRYGTALTTKGRLMVHTDWSVGRSIPRGVLVKVSSAKGR